MNTAIPTPLQSIQTPDLLNERLARLKAEFPDLFTNEGQLNPAELLRLTGQLSREHFDFSWWGKSDAKRKAFTSTIAALRYDEARSVNPDKAGGNAIIEGENLEVLKLLLCAYRGQVKCIYIDPPYNTGNDFVYKDNFAEGTSAYWEQTGVTQGGVKMSTNTRADGRYHSNWLNMIYPRLLVARQLLREDGVIFVSIDDNEVTHLRKVMDEVFGELNFVCHINREAIKGGSKSSHFREVMDSVLCFAKEKNEFSAGGIVQAGIELNLHDEHGPYAKGRELNKWGAASRREDSPSMYFPIPGPNGEDVYPIRNDGTDGRWRYGKKTLLPMIERGDAIFERRVDGTYTVYQKIRESNPRLRQFTTLFKDKYINAKGTERIKEIFQTERSVFDFPKPVELVQDLLLASGVEADDIVLDFFAGSGTTADALLGLSSIEEIGGRFILVQIPELIPEGTIAADHGFKTISEATIERVKRVIQGYGDNPQPIDAGFKVFTLQKSAFPRADFAPDPDATEADQLAALKAFIADKEASLFNTLDAQAVRDEVLLKCGFQLDVQLTPIAEVTANQLYRARDQQTPPREAIVCFDSHLDTTTLEWLRQQKGQRVIVLEAALDTTGKWNLHHQLGDGLVVF